MILIIITSILLDIGQLHSNIRTGISYYLRGLAVWPALYIFKCCYRTHIYNVNPGLMNPGRLIVVVPQAIVIGYWNGTPRINSVGFTNPRLTLYIHIYVYIYIWYVCIYISYIHINMCFHSTGW